MSGKMIITNFENRFKVSGFDENGNGWSCKFFTSKNEAHDGTVELLKDFGRSNYEIIDQTR
jgi:hypothetical protein